MHFRWCLFQFGDSLRDVYQRFVDADGLDFVRVLHQDGVERQRLFAIGIEFVPANWGEHCKLV